MKITAVLLKQGQTDERREIDRLLLKHFAVEGLNYVNIYTIIMH